MVERRLLKCRWLCVFAVLAAVLVPGGGAAAAVLATGGVDVKDGRLDAGVGKGEVTVVVKRRPSWGEVSRRDVDCLSAWVCFGYVCLGVPGGHKFFLKSSTVCPESGERVFFGTTPRACVALFY